MLDLIFTAACHSFQHALNEKSGGETIKFLQCFVGHRGGLIEVDWDKTQGPTSKRSQVQKLDLLLGKHSKKCTCG